MTSQPTARRRWPWIVLIAVVLVVAAAVGLTLFYGQRGSDPKPIITPGPSTPSTPVASSTPAATGVDGCLGGPSRTPQAVLEAQKSAPQTPEGAVSFVVAFERWAAQKPTPPDNEVAQLDGTAWTAGDLASEVGSYDAFQAAQFHTTAANGFYRIESFDDKLDQVTVTVMLPLVISNAVDPTLRLTPSVVVKWTEHGWAIAGTANTADKDKLPTTGVAIPGGC